MNCRCQTTGHDPGCQHRTPAVQVIPALTNGSAAMPSVTVLPAKPVTYSTPPGAWVDTGEIHRAPLERALAEERTHADWLAAALDGLQEAVRRHQRAGLAMLDPTSLPEWDTAEVVIAAHEARRRDP